MNGSCWDEVNGWGKVRNWTDIRVGIFIHGHVGKIIRNVGIFIIIIIELVLTHLVLVLLLEQVISELDLLDLWRVLIGRVVISRGLWSGVVDRAVPDRLLCRDKKDLHPLVWPPHVWVGAVSSKVCAAGRTVSSRLVASSAHVGRAGCPSASLAST